MVVADTFAFDGRGHYRHRTVVEIQSQTDSVRDSQSSLGTGDYVVSADTVVEFPFSCPMGHFCVPALHGFVQQTGYLLLVYTMSWRHEARYTRVR